MVDTKLNEILIESYELRSELIVCKRSYDAVVDHNQLLEHILRDKGFIMDELYYEYRDWSK